MQMPPIGANLVEFSEHCYSNLCLKWGYKSIFAGEVYLIENIVFIIKKEKQKLRSVNIVLYYNYVADVP